MSSEQEDEEERSDNTPTSSTRSASEQRNALKDASDQYMALRAANVRICSHELRPAALEALVERLCDTITDVPASPNAAYVVKQARAISDLNHPQTTMLKLHDWLIGKDALYPDGTGTDMILSCVRIELERAYLPQSNKEHIRNLLGPPPTAQPDSLLGYMPYVIAQATESPSALTLDEDLLSTSFSICAEARYPFLTTRWEGHYEHGCARDGACVVRFLEHLYAYALHPGLPPPEETCHFSVYVNRETVRVYVHWRNGDQIEMQNILHTFLDNIAGVTEIRRFLHNLVDHAKGTRLLSIKAALALYRERVTERGDPLLGFPVQSVTSPATSASASASVLQWLDTTEGSTGTPAKKRSRTDSLDDVILDDDTRQARQGDL